MFYYQLDNNNNQSDNSNSINEYIYLPKELTDIYNVDQINLDETTFETDLIMCSNKHIKNQSLVRISTGNKKWLFYLLKKIKNKLFPDLQNIKLSQSNDFKKIVNLALTPNPALNSFPKPLNTKMILIRLQDKVQHFELDELMTHLLRCVYSVNVNKSECAKYLTEQALILFENDVHLNDIFFTSEYDNKTFDKYHIKRYQELYFQAILENILSSKEHMICLLENGLLVLLHKLKELFPEKKVHYWISSCLSALSFHPETHLHLFRTGWIGIFAEWLNSNDLRLNLEAAKTLHNMAYEESLDRSLYILHPLQNQFDSSELEFDIIFIHGLQGGVFKTWRQSDSMIQTSDYTECWPKSWLAKDFPKCRILAINYQTFLSNWNIVCGQAYTLKEKSHQLTQELVCANVGERPVIWITHSMGGLLLKQMLVNIDQTDKNKSILDQTKGIVFYSVPHKGSEMAVWSQNMQRIILPSNQFLELQKGSDYLRQF